jgi:replicative DNA helicase
MQYNSLDSERAVVGGLLLEPCVHRVAATRLTEEDFSDEKLGYTFRCINNMYRDDIPIDVVTVRDFISNDHQPKSRPWMVDFQFLALLLENSTGVNNIESYAKHIRECRINNAIEALKKDIKYENYQDTVSQIQNYELELEDKDESHVKAIVGKTVDYMQGLTTGGVGLPSGFKSLDALITGFRPETLTVLAGRPSMGKSTLALNIADAVSRTNNVLFYSLEMSQIQLMLKIASSHSNIHLSKITNNNMSDNESEVFYKAMAKVGNQNMTIVDKFGMSIHDITSKSRQINSENKLDMIVIDYLQIIKYDKGREISELGNITRELKYLSKELGIPVILLSQLNRAVEQRENKRPFMSDLRSSGEIEQDADCIIMVYRDEYYYPEESDDKGLAELIVTKNRMGELGFVKTQFLGQYSKFQDEEVNIYDK